MAIYPCERHVFCPAPRSAAVQRERRAGLSVGLYVDEGLDCVRNAHVKLDCAGIGSLAKSARPQNVGVAGFCYGAHVFLYSFGIGAVWRGGGRRLKAASSDTVSRVQ